MLTITAEATEKLKDIMAEKNRQDASLRIYIASGGCSGFSYGMAFDSEIAEDDRVIEQNGIKIVVDPLSSNYLDGAQVDYVESLMGGGFTVNNPNAVSTCGCGQSFKTAKDEGQAKPCGH